MNICYWFLVVCCWKVFRSYSKQGNQKTGSFATRLFIIATNRLAVKLANDVGEDVTDCWAKQSKDNDNNYSYQYENQSVFY